MGFPESAMELLPYRPPYRWEEMLRFLAGRTIPGVEIVANNEYLRTVHLQNAKDERVHGWVRVSHAPKKNALTVTMNETLLPVLPQVLANVSHAFDLCCDPKMIYKTLAPMNDICPGLCVLGIRLSGGFDVFETAVMAVLGQQITVKAARTLAGRLVNAFGAPMQTSVEGLTHIFPSPEDILALKGSIENHLGPLGIIATRARAIHALAKAIVQGEIDLDDCDQPEAEIKKLMAIPGIGSWTAHYIAMRTMKYTDAFLEKDVGVKKALQQDSPKELLKLAEAWRPWRSYATINLWNSLKT